MPVQTHDSNLKVLATIFEARYDEGFRFLDHAGELLVRLRRKNPSWTIVRISQTTITLLHQQDNITLNVGVEKLDTSLSGKPHIANAEKSIKPLGEATEELYQLTLDVLKIPRTIRVGARFVFLAPSDNLEEADRFMWKAAASPLLVAVADKTKSQGSEAQVRYVLDDPETGHRRGVSIYSAVVQQKPDDPPHLGLPGDKGSGGIIVDLDVYTRPEDAHFSKISLFVQNSYLKSRAQASAILAWMVGQQK